MTKVAIVTDSVAGIPAEFQQQLAIHVAPNILIWGQEEFRDGVDIQPDEFYRRLRTASTMPTTAAVPPAAFQEIFSRLVDQGQDVLAVLTGSKLSAIYENAVRAKAMIPNGRIELIDSQTFAMWLGWSVIQAARDAAKAADLETCTAVARQTLARSGGYVMVDTLEFLQRSGRISNAQRLFGTMLRMKPVLSVIDGEMVPVERVRTRQKAFQYIVDTAEAELNGRDNIRIAVMHADAHDSAQELLALLSEKISFQETIITSIGPNIGSHSGPGAVGICYTSE